jgi:adenosylcobinamide kinase/adenosylcobinamide-phosphate guanylyltransferase
MNHITFILGGARSGKSRYAEQLLSREGKRTYIATAEIIDEEMRERMTQHRDRRGKAWTTCEEPLDLAAALANSDAKDGAILIDCITVWLANLIHHGRDTEGEVDRLCRTLKNVKGSVVIVANEVGLGIVPDNALARRFRDEAGRANQKIAAISGEVIFMSAGIPLVLKKRRRSQLKIPPAM